MDIISRMKQYMEYLQLRSSEFADTAGIPRPTLSQLLNGRNKSNEGAKKISSDIINKLHEAFPRLNVMWLLFGDGEMETDLNFEISDAQKVENNSISQRQVNEDKDFSQFNLFGDEFTDLTSEKNIKVQDEPNRSKRQVNEENQTSRPSSVPFPTPQPLAFQPDKTKRVQSIMVFYNDNSFEIFKPAE